MSLLPCRKTFVPVKRAEPYGVMFQKLKELASRHNYLYQTNSSGASIFLPGALPYVVCSCGLKSPQGDELFLLKKNLKTSQLSTLEVLF